MTVALLTGGSSNLSISLAKRLIDKSTTNLTIILTSRTLPKALDTISELHGYAQASSKFSVEFDYILVDFCDMVSVLSAYYDINKKYHHLDFLFINSAQTAYLGVDFWFAIKDIIRDPIFAVTEGQMKIQKAGLKSGDGMGLLFQGNVFGPYYLIHKLKPLLHKSKIIWVSSPASGAQYLSFNDLELVQNTSPYEGSKRLIDLLHMGSYRKLASEGIHQYVVNPGVFTSFVFNQYLNVFTFYGMLALFYMARFLGSKVHNISGHNAANSLMKCAWGDEPQDKKVASCSDVWGKEYVGYDEIDGTGAEDVVAYLDKLVRVWDEKLEGQIVGTRKP
ncbi:3-keto-steroid reductase [[Candida] jaroonii]|uniref:3-keto-steroid reductase n=1 Tax=[Candida] jaroonii TaxID=467808 RepID=A0ACA9YD04_9ASCO|nr:3-keto-steroid reductase [[Candida] jaroonii]